MVICKSLRIVVKQTTISRSVSYCTNHQSLCHPTSLLPNSQIYVHILYDSQYYSQRSRSDSLMELIRTIEPYTLKFSDLTLRITNDTTNGPRMSKKNAVLTKSALIAKHEKFLHILWRSFPTPGNKIRIYVYSICRASSHWKTMYERIPKQKKSEIYQ